MADSMNTVERQSKRRRCDSEGKGGSRGRGAKGRGGDGRGMGRGHGSAGSVSKDNPFYTKFNSYSQQYDESVCWGCLLCFGEACYSAHTPINTNSKIGGRDS